MLARVSTRVAVAADPERETLTAEGFLEWLQPGTCADLIDGAIRMHSPVSLPHAMLLNFLDRLLGAYVDRHRLGQLFREVVAVRLDPGNVFQPDLAFYRAARRSAFRHHYVAGAPDLAVEVLSPSTAARDTGLKFVAYERHGVTEYWILDPRTLAHRFYRRAGAELVEYAAGAPKIESLAVPGFFVLREWLDPDRTPPIADALARVGAPDAR